MKTYAVPNTRRKFRATLDRTPSGFPKGNANSSFLGSAAPAKDETIKFPRIVFGVEKPYAPTPTERKVVWGGVSKDSPRSAYDREAARRARAPFAAPKKATGRKAPKRRPAPTPPPAGTRPSLSAIRSKG